MQNAALLNCPVLCTSKGEDVRCAIMRDNQGIVAKFPGVIADLEIGDIHITAEPAVAKGTLFAPNGETIENIRLPTLMEKIDTKAIQPVTVTRGTLGWVATAFVLLQVAVNYGGSLWSRAQDEQTQKEHLTAVESQVVKVSTEVDKINLKFDTLQKTLNEQALRDAEQRGRDKALSDAEKLKNSQ